MALVVAVGAIFAAGAYAGRWVVKNQGFTRLREIFSFGARASSIDLVASGDGSRRIRILFNLKLQ